MYELMPGISHHLLRSLSYDGKPSPDHLYGVLKRHTDPPAVRLNPRTPTLLRRSGVLAQN
jgi:hypothetical protein